MLKRTALALCALFAQGTLAATYGVEVSNARTYANEVFGEGASDVVVDYKAAGPTVTLRVQTPAPETENIDDGDTADITFTLANAKFERNVRLPSLSVDSMVDVLSKEDGDGGDNTVTFRIQADQDLPTASTTLSFVFELPPLTGLNPEKAVSASVSVDAAGGGGWASTDDADSMVFAGTMLEDGVLTRPGAPLIAFDNGLAFSVASGPFSAASGHSGSTTIALTGGRTSLTDPGHATLGAVTAGLATAALCTGANPIPRGCVLQANGDEFSVSSREDGAGDLDIEVTGDFRDGDMVWLDYDGDREATDNEMLEMNESGAMTGDFNLSDLVGNSQAGEGEANDLDREEGLATHALYYMPNGEDGLRPAEFRSNFSVDFHGEGIADKLVQTSTVSTMYPTVASGPSGTTGMTIVEAMRQAPALPSPTPSTPGGAGGIDIGNLRITCKASTECVVSLECDDAEGNSWFAELDEPIPGRATLHMNTDAIAELLGLSAEEGWADNLSCMILSSRDIAVQVLTRSSGTLVNHTYVDDE